MALNLKSVKRYSIKDRKSLVSIRDFEDRKIPSKKLSNDFQNVVKSLKSAKKNKKPIIFGFGAHLIKCGLSKYVISLMKNGYISHIATNGAGVIHDFEIGMFGKTSEDVESGIKNGSFGFCKETGSMINNIVNDGAKKDIGFGESVGKFLISAKYNDYSILAAAYEMGIPVSVHVSIGTDIIHMHPEFDGSLTGKAAHIDFKKFCEFVSKLDGGVYLNVGSAVMLPEVFLKAVSISRNLGYPLKNFTTAAFDFIDHYRVRENVVRRPGGSGYYILGNHNETIPLLANALLKA
jgi:deoxyhypusine synthase